MGRKFGNGAGEIPPEYSPGTEIIGKWAVIHSGSRDYGPCFWPVNHRYETSIWGARHLITNHLDPNSYLNSSHEVLPGNTFRSRVSHYQDGVSFANSRNGESTIFRIKDSEILRRPAGQTNDNHRFWAEPSAFHKSSTVPLVGLAKKWGWIFAADSDTVYKLSYVSNSGTWSRGLIFWTHDNSGNANWDIAGIEAQTGSLKVTLKDGSTIRLNLKGDTL